MLPIIRVQKVEFNGKKFITNICLDKDNKECASVAYTYLLVGKNGKVKKQVANIYGKEHTRKTQKIIFPK